MTIFSLGATDTSNPACCTHDPNCRKRNMQPHIGTKFTHAARIRPHRTLWPSYKRMQPSVRQSSQHWLVMPPPRGVSIQVAQPAQTPRCRRVGKHWPASRAHELLRRDVLPADGVAPREDVVTHLLPPAATLYVRTIFDKNALQCRALAFAVCTRVRLACWDGTAH